MTPAPAHNRPTLVRYLVVAVTVSMSVILYLDRYCVSFAERYIREDLGLSETQMAWFLSAFFWTYALGQVPAGWLGDRLGSRGVLTLYIVGWSVFTALIGWSAGFAMLLAMRLGCGLSQSGAYPTAGSILKRWIPFPRRGFFSGVVALGGRLGAVIAHPLTAVLMVAFVPLSAPSLLTERSILDGPALCARLAPPAGGEPATASEEGQTPIEQRIHDQLPEEAQWIIEKYGNLQKQSAALARALTEGSAARSPASAARLTCDPEELQVLADGLNSLLEHEQLFDAADFARLKSAERQALDLEQRRARGETLAPAETARLNRLFLEGVFPREIGKLYVHGWRPVLYVYGLGGLAIAGLFWFCYRNSPAEHTWCNPAERELISGDAVSVAAATPSEPAPPFPWREVLRSTSQWLSSISQFGTNIAWLFFVTYFPRFLMEVHHVPILERSLMTAVPALAGIVGMLLGGMVTDSLVPWIGLRWARALPMSLTRFGAAATYLTGLWIDSPWAVTGAFALGFFFVDLGVGPTWAFVQDVGGRHVGSILGWGNMWGNFGAAAAPLLYNAVLGPTPQLADWHNMFLVCAGMFVMSGVAAFLIDATIPVVPVTPPQAEPVGAS